MLIDILYMYVIPITPCAMRTIMEADGYNINAEHAPSSQQKGAAEEAQQLSRPMHELFEMMSVVQRLLITVNIT